jgi:PAS domain S-box-containing protein
MPKITLDPAAPDRLLPPTRGQVDYWDGERSGLGLRVSQGGTKSWVAMVQTDGRKRRVTFGVYPELSLDGARRLLGRLKERAAPLPVAALERPRRPRGRPPKRLLVPPASPRPIDVAAAHTFALEPQSIVERLPCAILMLARDRILRVNRAAIVLLGATASDQLAGRGIEAAIHPADRARFSVQFLSRDLEQRAKPRLLRLRLVRVDGTEFAAEIAGAALADPSGADRILVLADRSEDAAAIDSLRGAVEHSEAVSEAKSSFLATMSHELRTPIAAMLGTLRLLQETGLDPGQRRHAAIATQAAEALLEVLHGASDLARIEAGKLELRHAPFDLPALVGAAVDLFAAGAEEKRVALRLEIAPDVPRLVAGDPGRLRQILVNLVSNALKFTDAGSVDVGVTALGNDGERRLVRFEVRDTGIGIPPDKRARLFTAHGRLDRPASKPRPGSGLGLSISQALVGLMGGTIGFESDYGKGSRFYFTIALAPTQAEGETQAPAAADIPAPMPAAPPAAPAEPPPIADVRARVPRILLCEDDEMLRAIMLAMLRDRPVAVETATRGDLAVTRVRDGDFDLVLMDVNMPGIDGLEATRLIRALPGKAGRTPILALTAGVSDEDRRRSLDAGMNDYLAKPVSRQALDAAIAHYLPAAAPNNPEDAMSEGSPESPPKTPPDPASALGAELDRATLEQLVRDIGAETLRTLILGMIEETDARIERMAQKYAAADWPELTREAHSLKGAARSYGAPRLAEVAFAIERAAAERRAGELAQPMAELPIATRATLAAFRALLGI